MAEYQNKSAQWSGHSGSIYCEQFQFCEYFWWNSKCDSCMSLMWIFNYYVRWVSGRCSRFKWSTLHNRNILATDCIHRIPCIAVYRTGWLLICGKLPKAQITNLFKLICMLNSIRSNNCQMQINLLEIDLPQYPPASGIVSNIHWNINSHWYDEFNQNEILNEWPRALFKWFQGL